MSRPARRTKKASAQQISSSHFVGYVEDEESIEAIMKKFQALEEYQTEISKAPEGAQEPDAGSATDNVMSEEQLKEVFKRTSGFSVAVALRNDYHDDDEDFWNEQLGFDEDDMDEYGFFGEDMDDEEAEEERRHRTPGSRKRSKEATAVRRVNKILHYQLTDRNGNLFTIKRRVRHIDPSVPTYTRIPSWPLPLSWAHIIRARADAAPVPETCRYLEAPLPSINPAQLKQLGNGFQGIYINAPLRLDEEDKTPGRISMRELAQLPIQDLCKNGFLFVWVDKRLVAEMVAVADKWSFKLVENLCWVRVNPNNTISNVPSTYINTSKLMLLMFRRVPLVEIEIRHQRSPDVVFDFIKSSDQVDDKPAAVYSTIETLLPQALVTPDNAKPNRLLQLWAPKGFTRSSWTTIGAQ